MIPENLTPLKIHARCIVAFDELKPQVEYACSTVEKTAGSDQPVKYFIPSLEPHDRKAVLVGSGPSVRDQVKRLKKQRRDPSSFFFGIKGGHDFLVKNKIDPHFGIAVDPQEKIHKENFLLRSPDCKYFLASQCHPSLFDTLIDRGDQVLIWHVATDSLIKWSQQDGSPIFRHYLIPGGSTSGLRAIVLAYSMGFRDFHLYGFDSCLSNKLRKITGELFEDESRIMPLTVMGKKFYADPAMAAQSNEFQGIVDQLWREQDPFTVRAYGDGLIQHLVRERYRQGFPEARV